jgi:hypothetical protein
LGVTTYPWARSLEIEANKFWVYGLGASILLSLVDLFTLPGSTVATKDKAEQYDEKAGKNKTTSKSKSNAKTNTSVPASPGSQKILKQLTIDICDLSVPGTLVGWISLDKAYVGAAMFISSVLAATDIWRSVQTASAPQQASVSKAKK